MRINLMKHTVTTALAIDFFAETVVKVWNSPGSEMTYRPTVSSGTLNSTIPIAYHNLPGTVNLCSFGSLKHSFSDTDFTDFPK